MMVRAASIRVRTHSPEKTRELGVLLAECLSGGEVILLRGPLGAGKTCLAQGIALGLQVGSEEYVTSPSFTIIKEYSGRLPLYHVDLFRIEGPEGVEGLGLDDYLGVGGVMVIEWPERGEPLLPRERLEVTLSFTDHDSREMHIRGHGEDYADLADRLKGMAGREGFEVA